MACGSGGTGAAKPFDNGRIANTGTSWWINVTKGVYFFSIKITNSYKDDAAGRATLISFTEDVLNKITPSTTAPASLLPAENEIAGWTYDQTSGYTMNGPALASTFQAATDLFDGAADPLFGVDSLGATIRSYVPVSLAWEIYTDGATTEHKMDAKIVQMASKTDAGKLFTDLVDGTYSQYKPSIIPWVQCTDSDPNPCGVLPASP
jgi:hypothetical protein